MSLHKSVHKGYKKIKMFYTGGTIGMQKNAEGELVPIPNTFKDKVKSMPELHNEEEAQKIRKEDRSFEFLLAQVDHQCKFVYNIDEYTPLLDSSNMDQDSWIRLAKDIKKYYHQYDGFIILHGTDTLSYTASALSFMLEDLRKPVILTGSMIPIYEMRTDATNNIVCSLILAGCYNIPEVTIFCGNRLLRGNRTSKSSSEALQAFDTLNYPPLVHMEGDIEVHLEYLLKVDSYPEKFHVQESLSNDVIVIDIYPGIKVQNLRRLLQPPVKGAVLRCFGAGNVPSHPEFIKVFEDAVQQGILLVRITQCHHGAVSGAYECGAVIVKAGVVCGADMTTEAAFGKLCWILARGDLSYQEKRQIMQNNVRGELTQEVEREKPS